MTNQGWSASSVVENGAATPRGPSQVLLFLCPILVFAVITLFAREWYSPHDAKWVAVTALAAICTLELFRLFRSGDLKPDAIDTAGFLLLAYAGLSLLWSVDPLTGIDALYKFGMLFLIFSCLRRSFNRALGLHLGIAILLGLAATIGMQLLSPVSEQFWGGYFNQNFWTETVLLGLPFLYLLYAELNGKALRWLVITSAIIFVTYLIFFVPSKIEFLTFIVLGLLVSATHLYKSSKFKAILFSLTLIFAGVALVIAGWDSATVRSSHGFKVSVLPRLEIAVNSLYLWLDRPVLGTGFGGFNALLPGYQDRFARLTNAQKSLNEELLMEPGAAHNDLIQFLSVFGLLGVGGLLFSVYAGRHQLLRWNSTHTTRTGSLVLVFGITNMLIEFPLQNHATALLFVLGLSLLLPIEPACNPEMHHKKPPVSLLGVAGLIVLGVLYLLGNWAYRFIPANHAYWLFVGRYGERPAEALVYNQQAIYLYPYSETFRRQLFPSLMRWMELENRKVAPDEVFDEFFRISTTTGLTGGILNMRLKYLMMTGRFDANSPEVKEWRRRLTTYQYLVPETWLIEAICEELSENPDGIESHLAHYLKFYEGNIPKQRERVVESLRASITRLRKVRAN
jgi:hypothetical protein